MNGRHNIGNKEPEQAFFDFFSRTAINTKLEQAFFEFEQKNADYAVKIAVVLQMIEQQERIKTNL